MKTSKEKFVLEIYQTIISRRPFMMADVLSDLSCSDIHIPKDALVISPNKRGIHKIIYFDRFKVIIYESEYYGKIKVR